ncbi:hypothetical protein [Sediminitomix flava]|uniref:Glycosyl hydrolase family 43 n=1 Tax=Sediminitomix flava TaxID=379075 RepID=A0A315ZGY0_SEDFL|nr:hypothetical protein [Sediminitomix flava]PWJ43984.1 hypothetical protein BC781_101334 [Sediminitomix flava]
MNKYLQFIGILVFQFMSLASSAQQNQEIKRYNAPDARQAVAADKEHIYVINNHKIVKRLKSDGSIVKIWEDERLHHMNSGIIFEGKLYCAHSNYPNIPMSSSIEIFDTETLEHIGSHSFGIAYGSATWIDQKDGEWYVMFAHYDKDSNRQTNRDVCWTQFVKFDQDWKRKGGWVLPKELSEKTTPYSISGGVFAENGKLITTHHHFKELYILSFPEMSSEMKWEKTIESPIRGQGIAFDTHEKNILWGIDKTSKEVIKTKFIWDENLN